MNGYGTRIIYTSCQDTSKGFGIQLLSKNKNEAKFKFQSQSARSQRWFDIDFDWIEANFSPHEPDLYKKSFIAMRKHKIQTNLK